MILYNYFRSSASYRVRIAMNVKKLTYKYVPIHLSRGGGEQHRPDFESINAARLVPVLVDGDVTISQSLAILNYLEEVYPDPALLPRDSAADRAFVRQLALTVACDVHPLSNLRVLNYIRGELELSEVKKQQWIQHWIQTGLAALELELQRSRKSGVFCCGDTPTIADCCLVPQMYNAERFGIDVKSYPRLHTIYKHCNEMDVFRNAHPAAQPDSE